MKDEADHKENKDDEDGEDLVAKAEKDFFEVIEAERKKRERDAAKKNQDYDDEEEKQDKGKVRSCTHVQCKSFSVPVM